MYFQFVPNSLSLSTATVQGALGFFSSTPPGMGPEASSSHHQLSRALPSFPWVCEGVEAMSRHMH